MEERATRTEAMKHVVTEQIAAVMRQRRQRGETIAAIARSMGFSKSTVSLHTRVTVLPLRQREPIPRPARPIGRRGVRYEVTIDRIYRRPGERIRAAFDHRPVYGDMMALCRAHGLNAVDFADDAGTHPQDCVYHGKVYLAKTQMYPLAYFTIRRIRGDVLLEDFFR